MKAIKTAGLILMLCIIGATGCARIAFYDDDKLQGSEVGIKLYYPKPYLLVSRTNNKDNPIQSTIIYLPDQSKPVYAKLHTGYGSSELGLTMENGVLKSINQKTDIKVPETLGSIATAMTAFAGLALQSAADYREISGQLKVIADGLTEQRKKSDQNRLLSALEMQQLGAAIANIKAASDSLGNPLTAIPGLSNTIAKIKNAKDVLLSIGSDPTPVRVTIKKYGEELDQILAKLSPKQEETPTFELYEIDNSSGTTILKKVTS